MENEKLIQEQQPSVQDVKPAKKKIRIGYIFLSIVPVALLLIIMTNIQMPFITIASFEANKNATTWQQSVTDLYSDPDILNGEAMKIFNEKYALYAYLGYAIVALIVFGIWYYRGFVRKNPKVRLSEVFGVKSICGTIGMAVGLQFTLIAAFTAIQMLFPHALDAYSEMIESSGLTTNVAIMVLYTIILAPLVEELCIRGLSFGFLEKSGIKPAGVIIISSILFGVMHLNLVQGIYAAVLGCLLGYLRYKYNSIKITVFMHICFNFLGSYAMQPLEKMNISNVTYLVIGGFALVVTVLAILFINSDKKAVKAIKNA